MIRLFKRLIQFILGLFKSSKAEIQEPEPTLYHDRLIIFKNAPLIGKVFHKGKQMYRVLNYKFYHGRYKCELELI